jgi:hypothetical protein
VHLSPRPTREGPVHPLSPSTSCYRRQGGRGGHPWHPGHVPAILRPPVRLRASSHPPRNPSAPFPSLAPPPLRFARARDRTAATPSIPRPPTSPRRAKASRSCATFPCFDYEHRPELGGRVHSPSTSPSLTAAASRRRIRRIPAIPDLPTSSTSIGVSPSAGSLSLPFRSMTLDVAPVLVCGRHGRSPSSRVRARSPAPGPALASHPRPWALRAPARFLPCLLPRPLLPTACCSALRLRCYLPLLTALLLLPLAATASCCLPLLATALSGRCC